MAAAGATIVDVDSSTFAREVIEESGSRPVVVDFWAPWCGPCRVLGPILERLAEEHGGSFRLAKVNVDENEELASGHEVQGIPAVKAFRDGQIVDEFVGALPETQIRSWLERFVPGPADAKVDLGRSLAAEGRLAESRAAFDEALKLRPRHPAALLELARLDTADGDRAMAERHLDLMNPDEAPDLAQAVAELRLQLGASDRRSVEELEARTRQQPDDLESRVALGKALAAAGRHEDALRTLLEVVSLSPREGAGEEARAAMLAVFEAVGARSELADTYRARMSAVLYK